MKTPINPAQFYEKIVNAQVASAESYVDPEWKLAILTYSNGLTQVYIEAKAPDGTSVQTFRFFAPYEAPPPPPSQPTPRPEPQIQKKQLPFTWADLLKQQGVDPYQQPEATLLPHYDATEAMQTPPQLGAQEEAAALEGTLREGGLEKLLQMVVQKAGGQTDPEFQAWKAEQEAQAIAARAAAIAAERQTEEEKARINANWGKLFPTVPFRPS